MQVNSGYKRGSKLISLDGDNTRPTLDKIKQAIFNMLNHDIHEMVVLDLFGGSGSLGIEALSNHASLVYFFDNNKDAISVISSNLLKLKFHKDTYFVYEMTYKQALNKLSNDRVLFDLIFLDPPYHLLLISSLLKSIKESSIIKINGLIVVEASLEEVVDNIDCFDLIKEKKYGKTKILIYRRTI